MLADGVHTPDHGKEETDKGRSRKSRADMADTVTDLRRVDTVAVYHGRESTAEAGAGKFARVVL